MRQSGEEGEEDGYRMFQTEERIATRLLGRYQWSLCLILGCLETDSGMEICGQLFIGSALRNHTCKEVRQAVELG